MAPRTAALPGLEADAGDGPQSPTVLDGIERFGATRFGEAVASVNITLVSGRRVRIELPAPAEVQLSELAERMLDTLRKVDGWVNGAALALILDPSGDIECHGGTFKRAAGELKRAGLIRSNKQHGYRTK